MDAMPKRRGVDIRVVLVGAIVLLLVFGGAAVWAYTTNADLERSRGTLAATTADLEDTTASLTEAEDALAGGTAGVAAEQKKIEADKTRITTLERQISRKEACIDAQTVNLAELRRMLGIQRANFDRTTSGSAWYKAHEASNKALDLAISYMAKAYTSAAGGSYGAANSWLSKSNAQVKVSNKQIDISNKQIDVFNAAVDEINKASDAFAVTLVKTSSTCGS